VARSAIARDASEASALDGCLRRLKTLGPREDGRLNCGRRRDGVELALGSGGGIARAAARRHRAILATAMDYAIELGLLDSNPIRVLKWTAPKVSSQVDRRGVVNPRTAPARAHNRV
jgi:hypothetical protein